MIITISGTPGSGKSTLAKNLASKLNLNHYSTGDFMRKIAKERNISLIKLSELAESDLSIDQEIDNYTKELARQDNFVIDSRLAYYFIPNSIKIFLDADLDERAKRIAQDKRKDEPSEIKKVKKEIQKRQESEKTRYQELYNLNPYNHDNFDLVIDTTDLQPQEVVEKVIEFLKNKNLYKKSDSPSPNANQKT